MIESEQAAFEGSASEAFSFLTTAYGYSLDAKQDGAVVFAKDGLSVRVSRDPRSCMIYVEVRRLDTGEVYVLHEILNALVPDETLGPQCSGADSTKTARCLEQLSALCQQHLPGVLAMDERTLAKVASSASEARKLHTLDAQYGAIRDRANRAWESKDWETARKLYEEAKPGLSASEKRRLDFLTKDNGQTA